MPHSVTPENASNTDPTISAEAGTDKGETQTTETSRTQEMAAENGNTHESEPADQDITMADVALVTDASAKPEMAPEVKLEDLFADMDSDEEFPSSTGPNLKITSSPPEAPPSPMSVVFPAPQRTMLII
jgi:DNA primase small subunit